MSPDEVGNEAEQDAVVCARRELWESVTEREELVGRFRVASRFPQYLSRISGVKEGHKRPDRGGASPT